MEVNRIRYTPEVVSYIRRAYPSGGVAGTLASWPFDGWKPSPSSLATKASALGIGRDDGHVRWTDERVEWFRSFVPGHEEREISAEHERVFGVPLTRCQIKSAKTRLGVRSGTHGGRFGKGDGGFRSEEHRRAFLESSRATRFRKGNVPCNARRIGDLRVSSDGYVWICVHEGLQGKPNANWEPLHRVLWCWRRGVRSVPDGHNVVFANKDRRDFSPENLVLVERRSWALMARRGCSYSDADSLMCSEVLAALEAEARSAGAGRRDGTECSR